jgi:hypothetical protein
MASAVVGPAAFALAARVAGGRVAGYSRRDEPISALAAHGSPAAGVMVPGFLGLAAGTAALGGSLRGTPAAPPPVPSLLMAAAVTTAGAGLARCSDRTCPTRFLGDDAAAVLLSDDLHAAFSFVTFALWTSIPLVAARRASSASAGYRRSSRRLGLLTLALLLVGGQLARRPSKRWSGTAQRAMLAAAMAWYPVAARQPA